ncbi:hypothetical protein NP233_g2199 [Leucocoprinus birnbaumii]|uniref:Uncharacterized protein n=1 Tax=Leucocoprinus birnbaumii TaxID=56174 RepID=A0AAD5W0R1_9AGAR|nr:hypothetical protein NP233_g2199 [Leucocoprinus birnbaumii]
MFTPALLHKIHGLEDSFGAARPKETTETPEGQKESTIEVEKPEGFKPQAPPVEDATMKATTETLPEVVETVEIVESITTTPEVEKPRKKIKRTSLTPKHKQRRFDEHISFMQPRLSRPPKLHSPLIRKNTWIRLLALCQTEEQLKQVIDMMPSWKDAGCNFDATFSRAFIRRCLYLKKPEFALDVFGNFGRYNVPLTQEGARELLNGIYYTQPIESVILLTSLFDVYKLQPAADDLASCAMVLAACLKSQNDDARVVADALLPHLKTIVKKAGPLPLPDGGVDVERYLPLKYGADALRRIVNLLPAEGSSQVAEIRKGLHQWSVESGHVRQTSVTV